MKEFVIIKNIYGVMGIGNYDKEIDAYYFMNFGYLTESAFIQRNFEYIFVSREELEGFLEKVKKKQECKHKTRVGDFRRQVILQNGEMVDAAYPIMLEKCIDCGTVIAQPGE